MHRMLKARLLAPALLLALLSPAAMAVDSDEFAGLDELAAEALEAPATDTSKTGRKGRKADDGPAKSGLVETSLEDPGFDDPEEIEAGGADEFDDDPDFDDHSADPDFDDPVEPGLEDDPGSGPDPGSDQDPDFSGDPDFDAPAATRDRVDDAPEFDGDFGGEAAGGGDVHDGLRAEPLLNTDFADPPDDFEFSAETERESTEEADLGDGLDELGADLPEAATKDATVLQSDQIDLSGFDDDLLGE